MSDIIQADIVVVDADTLIYQAAAVNEERTISVTHEPTGIVKSFNTRTEFKKTMKEKQKEITADYLICDVQTPKDLSCTLHSIDLSINKLEAKFPFADFIYCAGDENNFRLDLPLPKRYKSGRDTTLRPKLLKAAHSYFDKKYKPKKANGYEADDLSAILAYEHQHDGNNVVLAGTDKDSKQFVGITLWNYNKPDERPVCIQDMHPMSLGSYKQILSYGIPYLAAQLLLGDKTDGFSPTDLCNDRFGTAACLKLLKDCKTPKEVLEVVVKQYQTWFPDTIEYTAWNGDKIEADWKYILELYFKCARMKTSYTDELNVWEFMEGYNVKFK